MSTHVLKTWPEYFEPILDGRKRHELRVWDREFEVDDILTLQEWDPLHESAELEVFLAIPKENQDAAEDPRYTGRDVFVRVTYITPRGVFGLPESLCLMSIEPVAATSGPRRHGSTQRMAAVRAPIQDED